MQPKKKSQGTLQFRFGSIEQVVQLDAKPHDVFDALLDPVKHSDFTGSPATTSRRTGARFTAWDSYISGKNIRFVKDKKIVQEWKTTEWPKGYPPSKLEFTLTAKNGRTELKMVHSKVPAKVSTRDPVERVVQVAKETHRRCPVHATLARATDLTFKLVVNGQSVQI